MGLPHEVTLTLDALLPGIQKALRTNLAGVYVRGSLAAGDFDPATSDIDLLAVTRRPACDAEFASLADLHARLAMLPHRYADQVEIAYLDEGSARRFVPGQHHPTLGRGEALVWTEHRANWVLERWTLREHGLSLLGPDPRALIDPVSPQEVRAAVRSRMRDWADCADQPDDPGWLGPTRGYLAYVVETMCRGLATLARGAPQSKPMAVAWALATLPQPWRSTVERARAWRTDQAVDATPVPEVRSFIRWAAAEATFR